MRLRFYCFVGWLAGACHVFAAGELPIALPRIAPDSPAKAAGEAYRNGWLSRAVDLATPLADAGDADALFLLGLAKEEAAAAKLSKRQAMVYFYRGAGAAGHPEGEMRCWLTLIGSQVEENTEEGRSKLAAATSGGDVRAMRIAGEAEARGFMQGTPDFSKAKDWWEKAAAAGDTPSLLLLARLSEGAFGEAGAATPGMALDYYRKALDAGEKDALLPMARLLLDGGDAEARQLLASAASEGSPGAYRVLADMERKKGNDEAAFEYWRRGAVGGDATCMRMLAKQSMAQGKRNEAIELLKRAAEIGDPEAAADMGHHLSGTDPQLAAKYLLDAAEARIHRAQFDLAMLYLDGKLGRKDPFAAVAWLTEAMNSGDAGMQYQLATLHEQGIGCPINYANAGVLYTMACNKGHAGAAGRIAFMASEGLGTRLDPVNAYAYATLAVERGNEDSKRLLEKLAPKLTPTDKAEAAVKLQKLKGGAGASVGNGEDADKGQSSNR